MSDDREKWIEKVQKLLAKAESTTPEEAVALLEKVGELMAKWRISDAELAARGGRKEAFKKDRITLGTYIPDADFRAIAMVVEPLGVRAAYGRYHGRGSKPFAVLYGWETDIERAQMFWTSIQTQMVLAMKQAEAAMNFTNRNVLRRWRASFKLGYAARVNRRMMDAKKKAEAKVAATGMELVLARDLEAARQFAEETTPMKSRGTQIDSRGLGAGDHAGKTADLGQDRLADHKSKELTS